ncbi:DNA-formamidopyrimidine glycosylase family protein [Mucilaginibacter phyllosphaerae]|uniref:Endonuclease n=1 Tax=Mucilaginibacter phyllosphaerae TaxID=1812349 RepID=A0A4Y8AJ39_9SPHI|nr:DNA-formamidopyrimidine glycosylase family protein [Mucilaginibacter phyllosphaerae]MBB3967903.1 endonuclease-8 [Mucilaginibacter phyllosphaerae]TEW69056.1 endonuclease [Mucilaginibacter phyllosphaerae]
MPEGPSIVILKEKVQQFTGKKVIAAGCNNGALDAGLLINKTITGFKSWGKHFLICFPKFTIRIHLMMFGTYRINTHTEKPPRLHLQFADGELNFYACQLQLITEPLNKVYDWKADIMSDKWDTKHAIKKMKAEPALLACDALMNQQIFSGVGNIIKNEVLFRTCIHPESLVAAIPPKKMKELIAKAINYSFEFLEQKKKGTLKKHWQAYHKKECPRNHVPFMVEDTGRSRRASFYCELCQIKY